MDLISEYMLWLKAVHIIAVIAWMAGLFYMPRLLVYHAENANEKNIGQLFGVMESRLYKIIMMPAMILSLASGIILAIVLHAWSSGWLHLKLASVLLLVAYHFLLQHWHKEMVSGICRKSPKFFRIINEIPTILLVIIVIAVVVKPF